MIEGAAERILLPHFIEHAHPKLAERYISLLEIGGSHAHRLRPLIEQLEIPTLVVTDLDAVNPANNRKGVQPTIGAGYESGNSVLKTWLPGKTKVDDLLAQPEVLEKTATGFGSVGVVYQRAQKVQCDDDAEPVSLVPSTFEDALVVTNLDLTKGLGGVTMTNALAKIANDAKTANTLGKELFDRLSKNPQKAAFALDLLDVQNIKQLAAPPYVEAGLEWLEKQLTSNGGLA